MTDTDKVLEETRAFLNRLRCERRAEHATPEWKAERALTRAWIREEVLEEIRGAYKFYREDLQRGEENGYGHIVREPTLTVAYLRAFLDQCGGRTSEWRCLLHKEQTSLVASVMDALVREGILECALGLSSHKREARCYAPKAKP